MATKQLKLTLQAQPLGGSDVTVVVTVDGEVKFNQTVPEAGPIVLNQPNPNEYIEIDIDVPVLDVIDYANVPSTVTLPVSISSTNGAIKIDYFSDNFFLGWQESPPASNNFVQVAGTASTWHEPCEIVSQPLWNGEALLNRYNIEYNNGPAQVTGPGEILIENGETVTFDLKVNKFNDTIPVPVVY